MLTLVPCGFKVGIDNRTLRPILTIGFDHAITILWRPRDQVCSFASYRSRKDKVARNKLGPIPDDYFENDPIYPPTKTPPLSKALLDYIEAVRSENEDSDKYRPGDIVGGYTPGY